MKHLSIIQQKLLLNFLILLASSTSVLAQAGKGRITGLIQSKEGNPLSGISITLDGTDLGTISNEFGEFSIRNIPAGTYTLKATSVGYAATKQNVTVGSGKVSHLEFQLDESTQELKEVIIRTTSNKYKVGSPSSSLRIQTPILETPQNIQIINRNLFTDQQTFDMLEGISRNVSGVQRVEHWDNYARINMRGSQVTAFRNGMNVQMPWGPLTEDVSMVEQIEFVKGPAGFMLSAGEPSGFYNVVTKKPTGKTRGEVGFSLGSFETYRATADLDGKLSKDGRLLYRLNVMGQLKGSHRDYEYTNRYAIVPVLKYLVNDKTSVTLEYTEQFSQMSVIGGNYAFSSRGYADLPVNFTTAEPNLDPTNINDRSVLAIFEHQISKNWKFTAQGAYFHFKQVGQSIWPWGFAKTNDSWVQRGISIWDALSFNKTGQFFINGLAKTGGISHTIIAGLDMGHKDYYADWNQSAALGDSTFNIYNPVYGQIPASEIPTWDRSKDIRERGVRYNTSYNSLYVQDEIGFIDNKIRLTLAGRYTANKYLNPYEGSTDDGKFTPRVGLSYSLNRSASAYFVYDQAFLANPGTDWQGKNFDPVTGDNIELGLKKDWFNGKWIMTLSAYQITKNNVLTQDLEHTNGAGQLVYSRQSGQQQVKGLEFDIKGQVLPGLDVVVNYAYTDAKTTKDSNPEIVGNKVAGATEHIQNTWLNYNFNRGVLNGLKLSLGYQYQAGRSSWYVFDGSENSLPDYFRVDAGVSYTIDKLSFNLIVNNLQNKYLYSGAPYGDYFYWQAEPKRNSRLTVTYKF
jgi:iron complex outermembrane recepter protein